MPLLGADGLYVGAAAAAKVYLGAGEVWAAGGGEPTTYTIHAVANGQVECISGTYSSARNGTGSLSAWTTFNQYVSGQYLSGDYVCVEGVLSFDTSTVVGTIQSASLSLYGHSDLSDTDFTLEARLHDWGDTLTTADFVAGASLSSKTLLATLATSAGWSTAGYNALTSEAAFVSNINQAGFTRLLLCSSRMVAGTAPSGNERVTWKSIANAGTDLDPKLVIEALV